MAKTIFHDGDFLYKEYLQSMYGIDAASGHVHDGGGNDGSAPQVNLASHVTGVLPLANMTQHVHNGTQETRVQLTAAAEVQGQLPLANQIHGADDAWGGTADTNNFTTTVTATFGYRRVDNWIDLYCYGFNGTDGSVHAMGFTWTGSSPAPIFPSGGGYIYVPSMVVNNSLSYSGCWIITQQGSTYTIQFALETAGIYTTTGFSGLKGINGPTAVRYLWA